MHLNTPYNNLCYYNIMSGLYRNNTDVIILTDSDFDNNGKVKKPELQNRFGLIKFYATWCPHCKNKVNDIEFLAEGLEKEKTNFYIGVVNIDNEKNIKQKMGVQGIPSFFFVNKNGILEELQNFVFSVENTLLTICEKTQKCCNQSCKSLNRLKKKKI